MSDQTGSTEEKPATSTSPLSPPPGWYADPCGDAEQRYWDGTAWTVHVAGTRIVEMPPVAPTPPPAAPRPRYRRAWIVVAVLALAAATFFVVRSVTGDSGGGGTSEEQAVAADVAEDLIGDGARPLGASVPSQLPDDFPLPDDATVVAAFAAADSESTVSATFTTAVDDAEDFVIDGLEPAGYEMSSDFQFTLPADEAEASCAGYATTFGFFRGGDLVGLVNVTEPGGQSSCRVMITVAVGPEVIRTG